MKQKYFSKLENKYYYGISRTFWHFFTAIAVLGFIAGIFVIGWSYIPPSKPDVQKAQTPQKTEYPPQADVSINDILAVLPKDKKAVEEIVKTAANISESPKTANNTINVRDTKDIDLFEKQIAFLKNTLPLNKFAKLWNGDGYYKYESEQDEKKFKATKNEKYRKFFSTQSGLIEKIETKTDKFGFKSYKKKAALVENYNNILNSIDVDNRSIVLNSLINFQNRDFTKTIASLGLLHDITSLFDQKNVVKAFNTSLRFLQNNPNDGIPLINFEKEVLPKFPKMERYTASSIIKSEYINYYNNNINGIKENTLNFIPFLKDIEKDKRAVALKYYYDIYRSKNSNRLSQIQNIEEQYNRQLASIEANFQQEIIDAEITFSAKKEIRSFWRSQSFKVIAIALGTVLLITVILLLLSMVRNVNKLAEAMLKNNAKNN
jgi:hypothetical protein